LVKGIVGLGEITDARWKRFERAYRSEMRKPEADHLLGTLARLSHGADFAVGCYCADFRRCHRSILAELLSEHGAKVAVAE
jgi:uncharacterized protein YeaO (DUF488 family)